MNTTKAIRRIKAAIEMLDQAVDSLPVDDSQRKSIVSVRQLVESILDRLED